MNVHAPAPVPGSPLFGNGRGSGGNVDGHGNGPGDPFPRPRPGPGAGRRLTSAAHHEKFKTVNTQRATFFAYFWFSYRPEGRELEDARA